MDAFAVSICKGLAMKKLTVKQAVIVGAWFGGFQALMPTLGYLLGTTFARFVNVVSDWIAFVLLALIGANMIKEALSREEEEEADASLGVKEMFVLAVATSIDAFAVGVSFACMEIGSMIVLLLRALPEGDAPMLRSVRGGPLCGTFAHYCLIVAPFNAVENT